MKKYFSLSLAMLVLINSLSITTLAAPADAVVENTQDATENKDMNVRVDTSKGSTFSVVLPKTIQIDPDDGLGVYTVEVTGDLNPNRVINIKCDEEIQLQTADRIESVLFDVTKTKTKWTWSDLFGGQKSSVTETISLQEGEKIPAGESTGILTFNINCENDLLEGVLLKSDLEFLGYDLNTATDINIPASIDYGEGKIKNINSVGGSLFQGNTVIQSVTIAEGVKEIGPYAFEGCTNLTSVGFPTSLTDIRTAAFKDTTSLPSYHVGKNIDKIEERAFENSGIKSLTFDDLDGAESVYCGGYCFKDCDNLVTLTFPTTREVKLGNSAFLNCSSLEEVSAGSNIALYSATFAECTSLETATLDFSYDGSTTISVFSGCSNLREVHLTGLTEIGKYTCHNCPNLETFTVNAGVTKIGKGAFVDCKKLTTLPIQPTLTEIGEDAFYNCYAADGSYVIPAGVTVIPESAFKKCMAIDSLTFEGVITEIGEAAFKNCGGSTLTFKDGLHTIGYDAFAYSADFTGNKVTSISLPDSVTSIGASAFKRVAFTEFTVPSGVTVLSDELFAECNQLATVNMHNNITQFGVRTFEATGLTALPTIPSGVSVIPEKCFWNCDSLTKITIPDNISVIGIEAFRSCENLTAASIPSVTNVDSSAFSGSVNITRR